MGVSSSGTMNCCPGPATLHVVRPGISRLSMLLGQASFLFGCTGCLSSIVLALRQGEISPLLIILFAWSFLLLHLSLSLSFVPVRAVPIYRGKDVYSVRVHILPTDQEVVPLGQAYCLGAPGSCFRIFWSHRWGDLGEQVSFVLAEDIRQVEALTRLAPWFMSKNIHRISVLGGVESPEQQ